MLDESSYPTVKPQPWRTTKEVQGDATDEIRTKWLADCQLKGDHPCRKIVFTIKSHDQGWGGGRENRGTYKGSYSWFDAGKEELVAFREGRYLLFSLLSCSYMFLLTSFQATNLLHSHQNPSTQSRFPKNHRPTAHQSPVHSTP